MDSFGLNIDGIDGKLYFPHDFNRPEHYEIVNHGPHAIEWYKPNTMMPKNRAKFLEWHAAESAKGEPWVLKEKLAEYCRVGEFFYNFLRILREFLAKIHDFSHF